MEFMGDTEIHRFMDRNEDLALYNQVDRQPNEDAARSFIREHSTLTATEIDQYLYAMDSGDGDGNYDEAGEILSTANLQRTYEEISEAHHQAWDRLWYGRSDNSNPVALPHMTELEMKYPDIQDPKYYEQFGWGYLSGVKAALAWALGSSWGDLDT
jgi:hypothetical protein